jgi:DNA-binding MarR family transcriptional regulator
MERSGESDPPRRTPAGDAMSAFAIRVFLVHGRLVAAGDALARPAGQTSARWLVLAAVEDEPLTVAQVARRLHLARQSVQPVANLLVRGRFAAFHENPRDRRAQLLALTPAGRESLGAIQAAQREWADALGARIGARRLGRAVAILDQVIRAMQTPLTPARSRRPANRKPIVDSRLAAAIPPRRAREP